MRVLHVVAGSRIGGAETYCSDLIGELHRQGCSQFVLCRPDTPAEATAHRNGIPFRHMGFTMLDRYVLGRGKVAAVARDFAPDVIHVWMGRAASVLNRRLPWPTIGWFGGYYDLKRYQGCDAFVTVTYDISRHVMDSGGAINRVHTVHTFGTLPETPVVKRADLDTPEDATVILLPARMHRVKGIDVMLRAMTTLPPDCILWLAGDGPELQAMKDLAASLGVADRVRFLGWRTDRFGLMAAADIIAMPSRHEPFGTVMAEAWYVGKPLIAAAAQGPRQYLKDGENGLLVPVDDVAALADAVRALAGSAELRAKVVAGGTRTLNETFTAEISGTQMRAAYANTIRLYQAAGQGGQRDVAVLYRQASAILGADAVAALGADLPEPRRRNALTAGAAVLAAGGPAEVAEAVVRLELLAPEAAGPYADMARSGRVWDAQDVAQAIRSVGADRFAAFNPTVFL